MSLMPQQNVPVSRQGRSASPVAPQGGAEQSFPPFLLPFEDGAEQSFPIPPFMFPLEG